MLIKGVNSRVVGDNAWVNLNGGDVAYRVVHSEYIKNLEIHWLRCFLGWRICEQASGLARIHCGAEESIRRGKQDAELIQTDTGVETVSEKVVGSNDKSAFFPFEQRSCRMVCAPVCA